ncbi:serine hydrolase domain-containing protein [Shewanella khirikhana]|uniref:serine hydrolase domain-containing protein n=1 Tax=Shewanella khirikhana TaxID=1965282 RepID=UPI0030D35841
MKPETLRLLRIIMPLVGLISAVVFVPWAGVWLWLSPLPDTVEQQLDEATALGLGSVILYIDHPDRPAEHYVATAKDKRQSLPKGADSLFKIASISKLYIAAATAKLVAAGLLSLQSTVAELLPELAGRIANADSITLAMLVSHRSGIPNFVDAPGFDWAGGQQDPNDNLKLVLDKRADFAPGSDSAYSNTNYLLLGRILDNTLGYPHQQYIRKQLLAPLDLTDTFGDVVALEHQQASESAYLLASGFHQGVDEDLKSLIFNTPGGSMLATARDVGVFLRALITAAPDASHSEFQAQTATASASASAKKALLSAEEQAIYASIYQYEHTGWLPGYQSIVRYHSTPDAVVVQFVGSTGGESELLAHVLYQRVVKIVSRKPH